MVHVAVHFIDFIIDWNQNQNELYCQVCFCMYEFVFVTEASTVQQNDRTKTDNQK